MAIQGAENAEIPSYIVGWLFFDTILNQIWESKNLLNNLSYDGNFFKKFQKLRPQSASEILIEVMWFRAQSFVKAVLEILYCWPGPDSFSFAFSHMIHGFNSHWSIRRQNLTFHCLRSAWPKMRRAVKGEGMWCDTERHLRQLQPMYEPKQQQQQQQQQHVVDPARHFTESFLKATVWRIYFIGDNKID